MRTSAARGGIPPAEAHPVRRSRAGTPSAYAIACPLSGINDYWLNFLPIPADGEVPGRCRQSAVWHVGGGVGFEGGSPGLGSIRHVSRPDANSAGAPAMTGPQLCTLRTISSCRVSIPGRAMAARRTSRKILTLPTLDAHSFGLIGLIGPVSRAPVFQLIRLVTMSSDEGPPKLIASFQEASRSNCDVGTRAVRSVRKIH